jgi:hypothetical protein
VDCGQKKRVIPGDGGWGAGVQARELHSHIPNVDGRGQDEGLENEREASRLQPARDKDVGLCVEEKKYRQHSSRVDKHET